MGGAPENIQKGFRWRRARRQTRSVLHLQGLIAAGRDRGLLISCRQGLFKQSKSRSGTVLYGIGFLVFYLDAFS
ncbi:hypothetical protein, partial [Bradyrhizobium lupini]|uniref:hypothetical protein n=1 Tax=Rhizobium lupini TaxID=136996 RepID=UPI00296FF981